MCACARRLPVVAEGRAAPRGCSEATSAVQRAVGRGAEGNGGREGGEGQTSTGSRGGAVRTVERKSGRGALEGGNRSRGRESGKEEWARDES